MAKQQQIELGNLSVEQLTGLKEQFEGDIQHLTQAFDGLRGAHTRYLDSKHFLDTFKVLPDNSEIMVPLTSSLYVPGKVKNNQRVIVDVGTGYYIEHTCSRAQGFFEKRANQLRETMENISAQLTQKQKQLDSVLQMMQRKMQQQRQAQQEEA